MNRWYDRHRKLARLIEGMKDMEPARRDLRVKGILEMIRHRSPKLLDAFCMNFPMDFRRQRWYDRDPYLWLAVNGLRFADEALLAEVTVFLATQDDTAAERSS